MIGVMENTQKLFDSELIVINVGSKLFQEALIKQGVKAIQVDWKPPVDDDAEMQRILAQLGGL